MASCTTTDQEFSKTSTGPAPQLPSLGPPEGVHRTVIKPPGWWIAPNLREVWQYRDLLSLLVLRDITAKYRQSLVGIGWVVLKPMASMLIFTLIFGRVAKLPSDGIPYPVFSFAALLPWSYFANALTASSGSIVGGSGILTKVYFPRLVFPLTGVITGYVDLAIQMFVLVGLMTWYGVVPTWGVALVPAFVLLASATALSVGLWLTALNVKYRDVGHAVPFFTQAWMWMSPIVYSSSMIPERWRPLYGLNPMVGVIEGFRWAMLGKAPPDWTMMGVSGVVVLVLLATGLIYFRKVETTFADIV